MSNAHLLSECPTWLDIEKLPQVPQNHVMWQHARKNKQSSSDFASVVPYSEKFIGHIVKMWGYNSGEKPLVKYDENKTCGDISYTAYIVKKAFPYPRNENGEIIPDENDRKVGDKGTDTSTACGIGNRYEPIVRNLTIQLCQTQITEVGWIENMRVNSGGVSADGILCSRSTITSDGKQKLINYFVTNSAHSRFLSDNEIRVLSSGTKNFEAKTIVSREMCKRIPIKYHIQVERTAYELHLKSSVYAEAQFVELCEQDWRKSIHVVKDEIGCSIENYAKFGILLICETPNGENYHIWPHPFLRTPLHFNHWKNTIIQSQPENKITPIYFKLESFWVVEVPLWEKYEEIYGPLIKKEADYLHYLVHTPEGREEYQKICDQHKENAITRKREKPKTLYTENMAKSK